MELLLGAVLFLMLCAGVFVPLEHLFGTRAKYELRSSALCVCLFVLNTMLMGSFGAPLLEKIATEPLEEPGVPRIVAALLLGDLLGYLIHRAMHRVPLLWKLHRVHHADVELNWLEGWRQHPLDFLVHGFAVAVPGALLGASLSDLAAVVLIRKAWTSFLHADVPFRFGLLEYVFATPAFHRVHHSADPREFDQNFAGSFPLWDFVFGTLAPRVTEAAPAGSRLASPADSTARWSGPAAWSGNRRR
ncbi:MAG: sterol desaturase family protein [Myxococcaceae bacterium]